MSGQRPFRFGAGPGSPMSRTEWVTQARTVEDLGYATLLVADHFNRDWLAPLTALMAAADATRTMRIGTMVFANDYRHPVVLGKELATLDLLSEGRLEIAIGAGWVEPEYNQLGLRFDPPGTRIERLEEAVKILKGLFGETPVTFAGKHYAVTGVDGFPKPVQQPYPPLLIGGNGKRLLSLAAREANIIGLLMRTHGSQLDMSTSTTTAMAQRLSWIREAAGERFNELEINTVVFNVVVTDDRQQAVEQVAQGWGTTPEVVRDSIHVLVGTVDQMCEDLERWREQLGISYIAVPGQANIMALAPVVARLAGK